MGLKNLEKILDLKVDEERGIITSFDERFLIIPIKFIHSIEDRLVKIFGPIAATNFMYEMGKEAGKHSVQLVSAAGYDIAHEDDLRRMGKELVPLWGWGGLKSADLDLEKGVARSQRTNSIFVRNKKGKTAVCHFLRGLDAGAFEVVFGRRCESIELFCEGMGNTNCELVTGRPVEIATLAENLNYRPSSLSRDPTLVK